MWMKTGQSSSANFRPISRIQSAPHMLKKRYDEQNTVAGSDVEFADLAARLREVIESKIPLVYQD
jgi:hypothetical protein